MTMKKIRLIYPGEILLEEFMEPLGISQYRLAKDLHTSAIGISHIINGKRSITAEMALKLGRYFNMSPEFWINLQAHYDLECAKETSRYKDVEPRAA